MIEMFAGAGIALAAFTLGAACAYWARPEWAEAKPPTAPTPPASDPIVVPEKRTADEDNVRWVYDRDTGERYPVDKE